MKHCFLFQLAAMAVMYGFAMCGAARADDSGARLYELSVRMSATLEDLREITFPFRSAPEYPEMAQRLGEIQSRLQRIRRLASQPYGSAEIINQENEAISDTFQSYQQQLENAMVRNSRNGSRLYGDMRFLGDITNRFRGHIGDLDRLTDQIRDQERNFRQQPQSYTPHPPYPGYSNVPPGVATSDQFGYSPYVNPARRPQQWQQAPSYPQSAPYAYPGGNYPYQEDDRRRRQRGDRDDDDDDDDDDD